MSVTFLPPRGDHSHVDFNVALEKGDRRRWFWVYVAEHSPRARYKGLIKFDGRTHRGITTFELFEAMQFRLQCELEVAEHELDGWVRTAPPTPKAFRR